MLPATISAAVLSSPKADLLDMLSPQVKQHFKGVANSYSAIHDIPKYLAKTEGGGLQARAEAEMAALLVEVGSVLAHLANEHLDAQHNP